MIPEFSQHPDDCRFRAVNFAGMIGGFRKLRIGSHRDAAARWLTERGWTSQGELWRDPCAPHDSTSVAYATMVEIQRTAFDVLRGHGWTTDGYFWLSPDRKQRVRQTRVAFERMWLAAGVDGREQIELQLHSPRLDLEGRP